MAKPAKTTKGVKKHKHDHEHDLHSNRNDFNRLFSQVPLQEWIRKKKKSEHNNADDKLDTKVSVGGNMEEPCNNIEKVDKSRAPTAKVPQKPEANDGTTQMANTVVGETIGVPGMYFEGSTNITLLEPQRGGINS